MDEPMPQKDLEHIIKRLQQLTHVIDSMAIDLLETSNDQLRNCGVELHQGSKEVQSWIEGIEQELMPIATAAH